MAKPLDPRRYGKVTAVGTDKARLSWIKASWRRRGCVPPDDDWDGYASEMLERIGREHFDRIMHRLRDEATG